MKADINKHCGNNVSVDVDCSAEAKKSMFGTYVATEVSTFVLQNP